MKSFITRKSSVGPVAVLTVTLLSGLAAIPARADSWDKKTVLTVSQPTQIRDTVLQPGQYVFKLLDSNSDRHIVQIFNADQTRIVDTVLAIPNYRLQPTGDSRFIMWETPAGSAKALRAWFYPGDNFGQEFPYPKHLRQIAMNTEAAPAPPPPAAAAEPAPAATPEPAPVEAAPERPEAQQPAAEPPQSTPPPTPAPAESAPARSELPKTASPWQLAGLIGFSSLALLGMLRLTGGTVSTTRKREGRKWLDVTLQVLLWLS